jgi:hypothetical protein
MKGKIRAGDHEEGERCKCSGREKKGVMGKKEHRTGKNITAIRRKRKVAVKRDEWANKVERIEERKKE